jgi:tripartite-type tricarboxylate transporter receptor subunit TctC
MGMTEMTMMKRRSLCTGLVLAALTPLWMASQGALAQAWPTRTVKLVIPYDAGGPTDVLGRLLAPALAERLEQTVVVENRGGAAAIVGANAVAKSAPDGYTLLLGDINLAVNPSLYKTLPYDVNKELLPVALVAAAPLVLVVNAASPVKSLPELIARAKANPGKLSFGSAGAGNTTHLAPELLKAAAGLDIVHVPYKGIGPALTDLAAGTTDLVVTGVSGATPLLKAGKLRALAITGDRRAAALPDVPTFAEAGTPLPDMSLGSWWGVLVPAGVSRDIVQKLNRGIGEVLNSADLRGRLAGMNINPTHSTPAAFEDFIRAEGTRWARVLQRAKIQPE